ncbi:MAG TPA: hypothetical protein VMG14_05630 [Thermoplasmata archaeon]|nr:hypothetical protein [Thermoplasmata archaeon]
MATSSAPKDSFGEFGSKYGWILAIVLAPVFTIIIAYIARVQFAGPTVAGFAVASVVIWAIALAYFVTSILEPLGRLEGSGPSTGTAGKGTSLLSSIVQAQDDFLTDIYETTKAGPVKTDALDAIYILIGGVNVCASIEKTYGRVLTLRSAYLSALVITLPVVGFLSWIIGFLPQTTAYGIGGAVLTFIFSAMVWMMLMADHLGRLSVWKERVCGIAGPALTDYTRLKLRLKELGAERAKTFKKV